jgi:hypothetical protein
MIPALTRRRDPDAQQETWLIQYGDIHLGTIRLHAGVGGIDQWAWLCGFYPHPIAACALAAAPQASMRPALTSKRLGIDCCPRSPRPTLTNIGGIVRWKRGSSYPLIHTVRGVGYCLHAPC